MHHGETGVVSYYYKSKTMVHKIRASLSPPVPHPHPELPGRGRQGNCLRGLDSAALWLVWVSESFKNYILLYFQSVTFLNRAPLWFFFFNCGIYYYFFFLKKFLISSWRISTFGEVIVLLFQEIGGLRARVSCPWLKDLKNALLLQLCL